MYCLGTALVLLWYCRYNLPINVVIFNNGGIYGGDRREDQLKQAAAAGLAAAGHASDPIPTAFVPNARWGGGNLGV